MNQNKFKTNNKISLFGGFINCNSIERNHDYCKDYYLFGVLEKI